MTVLQAITCATRHSRWYAPTRFGVLLYLFRAEFPHKSVVFMRMRINEKTTPVEILEPYVRAFYQRLIGP